MLQKKDMEDGRKEEEEEGSDLETRN